MSAAVAYLRVSTQEQVGSGLGLEAQRAAIESCAARMGLAVAAWFADEGVSGAAPLDRRPGLVAAMDALRRGGVLIVAKRDRLARDAFLSVWLDRRAADKGARIISAAGEGTETDDPAAVLLRRLLDAVAEFERAQIRARTRAALDAKRARGERTGGGVPYGYDAAPGHGLTPNGREQAVLRRIAELRARDLGWRRIARALNDEGVPAKHGGAWDATRVRRALAHWTAKGAA